MFRQLFRLATLAKFATAATLIAGAYGTGNIDMPESRPLDSSLHAEKTPVVRSPEPTAKPEKTAQPATATKPVTSERYSFENLLKECVTRYTQQACEAAIRASGLDTDAFWAKYRSLMIPPTKPSTEATPTTSPRPSSTPKPTTSVQLSPECIAKYEAAKAAKNGPADVFEAA